jgi:hypothetical protein
MKKLVIISMVILLLVALSFSLGFFSPYNCFTAKRELKTNHFKKICINEKELWFIVEKKMGDKYGIDVVNISNLYETRPINYFGIKMYNKIMMRGFIKSNGDKIYKAYSNELDSLCSQRIYW